ncbi:MAG: flippase-like domain-containing protein [Provencibacterium sp.]|jgi:uncharacterized protein (TIRG00374 family)|nr:flippase-like domain-containing protein [Provencibacterium sp.]
MSRKSKIWNGAVLLFCAAALIGSILTAGKPAHFREALRSVHPAFLAGALGCMVGYWALESVCLHLAAQKLYPAQRMADSVTVAMIGQLFNCVTPFASGGQPAQVMGLMRRGMPAGKASSALVGKFIVYQVVLSLYSLVALTGRAYFTQLQGITPLVMTGFAVNAAVMAGLLGICFFPALSRRAALWALRLCGRLRLLKDPQRTEEAVLRELNAFYESFQALRQSPALILKLAVLSALQLTAFFVAPYFVCRALGSSLSLAAALCAGAFVLMISSFVPLPGGSGGAEGGFFFFFHLFFPSAALVGLALLLWRAVTFYLPIVAGGCFWATDKRPRLRRPV